MRFGMTRNDDRQMPVPLPELREWLAGHRDGLARYGSNEFLDRDLALDLHRKLESLLGKWDIYDIPEQHLIAETIRYLVDAEDEEHDLRSPIGFVDDEERVIDLLRQLAPDLLTE
jgi:hypothetical protein